MQTVRIDVDAPGVGAYDADGSRIRWAPPGEWWSAVLRRPDGTETMCGPAGEVLAIHHRTGISPARNVRRDEGDARRGENADDSERD